MQVDFCDDFNFDAPKANDIEHILFCFAFSLRVPVAFVKVGLDLFYIILHRRN
jgi:hypothetical protein